MKFKLQIIITKALFLDLKSKINKIFYKMKDRNLKIYTKNINKNKNKEEQSNFLR